MIKVHIRRKVSPQKRDKLQVLINKLRALTMGQPGYRLTSFWGKRLTTKYMNMIKTVFKSSSFARCLCYVSLQNARVLACTLCF